VKAIPYADLSWPEVADLPRHVPLLIPLGEEPYDWKAAARALKAETVVTLPAVPYGFPREGDLGDLAVGRGLLRRVLLGIVREMRAQGFTRPIFLDGVGVGRRVDRSGLRFLKASFGGRARTKVWRWPANLAERVVVISTGHTEQHALHLPLETDTHRRRYRLRIERFCPRTGRLSAGLALRREYAHPSVPRDVESGRPHL
jgi:hypothetical protein